MAKPPGFTNVNFNHHQDMMSAFSRAEGTTQRPDGMGAKYGFSVGGKPLSEAQHASVLKAGKASALKRSARSGKALTRVKTSFLE